jgi:uncharacterized protein (TIGR04255 family)
MPLLSYKRVKYKRNPLAQVVCQLRFPQILVLDEKKPADFQDKIRDIFPLFQVTVEQQPQTLFSPSSEQALASTPIVKFEPVYNYRFSSIAQDWHINLTSTFLALTTSEYDRWEFFLERLQTPLSALREIYRPSFFERVGLRYIDAFNRSTLDLKDVPWNELIQPFALAFMSNPDMLSDLKSQNLIIELDIGGDSTARINIAKGMILDWRKGNLADDPEESIIVDSDMYKLRIKIEELDICLEHLHDCSTRLLRSIIRDKLHKAMEPVDI